MPLLQQVRQFAMYAVKFVVAHVTTERKHLNIASIDLLEVELRYLGMG